MARRPIDIDDSRWDEVMFINGYAVFMGYLLMGVRGLALLVVTWSTTVLLGGYVDELKRIDFLSLTFITLIQSARVFDLLVTETLRDVINSGWGLLAAVGSIIMDSSKRQAMPSNARWALTYGVFAVQLLVFAFLLCPLVILYTLGIFISTGISLWRLIDHDFGMIKEGSHLKPALEVLYSLAVAQGILFGYRFLYDHRATKVRIAKEVGDWHQLDEEMVLDYLKETVRECEKDPSFARGRNLVTYAVNLVMKPNSRRSYLSGVLILGGLLRQKYRWFGQSGLIKQLLTGSASFSHVVQRLMETFGPTSPYNTKIREKAARIVALVAGSIRLEEFPGGAIHCISSLLDTFEDYKWRPEGYARHNSIPKEYDRDWLFEEYDHDYVKIDSITKQKAADSQSPKSDHQQVHDYKGMVEVGLRILQKLAVDAGNCMVISSTEGLVLKTMAHVTSDQLHRDHHGEWCGIAAESLKLMSRLMAAPGEIGRKLRHQISSNTEAVIRTSETVLECHRCHVLLKRQTIQVLLDMSVDTSSIVANESRKVVFSWILLHIFVLSDHCFREACGSTHLAKKGSQIRKIAGERLLSVLSLHCEGSAASMLQSLGAVAGQLIRRTITVDAIDNPYRLAAVQILVHLCGNYTEPDEFLVGLKNGIADVLPKVLKEMLDFRSTTEKIQVVTESNKDQISAPGADIETGGVSQGDGLENASSSQQKNGNEQLEGSKLQVALISLCMGIIQNWINTDQDLTRRFNGITASICSEQGMPDKSFASFVNEAHDKLASEEEKGSRVSDSTGYFVK